MNQKISNHSKKLEHPDDSAAALLVELLNGTTGRNFDIESLFVERLSSGQWRWVIYEFLKADSISPQKSSPNYYWHKNSRKFLSLWAVVNTFRKAGYLADLVLINYADDRSLGIKEMVVKSIETNPTAVFREACEGKPRLMHHVVSDDRLMSFDDFKKAFVKFNDEKKGDTWEVLDSSASLLSNYETLARKVVAAVVESGVPIPEIKNLNEKSKEEIVHVDQRNAKCDTEGCRGYISDKVKSYSIKHFSGKIYCMNCQKKHK